MTCPTTTGAGRGRDSEDREKSLECAVSYVSSTVERCRARKITAV